MCRLEKNALNSSLVSVLGGVYSFMLEWMLRYPKLIFSGKLDLGLSESKDMIVKLALHHRASIRPES